MNRKNNTPRRKRMNHEARLRKAKEWIPTYTGKCIIKGYAKWFGVDWLCAMNELKLAGVSISDEEEKKIVLGYNQRIEQRRREKELRTAKLAVTKFFDEEANASGFDMVIGYTSGGFPYGIKSEEEIEQFKDVPSDERFEREGEIVEKEEMDNRDCDLPF